MTIYVAGRLNIDYNIVLSSYLRRGEKVVAPFIEKSFGGTAGNIATAIARILGPNKVKLVGAIGSDPEGTKYLEILRNDGIDTSLILRFEGVSTGRAYILTEPDGTSTIVSIPGANNLLNVAMLQNNDFNDMEMLVIANPPKDVASFLASEARKRNVFTILDPGRWFESFDEFKEYINPDKCIYIPNEFEFLEFVNADNIYEGIKTFVKEYSKCILIVKRGRGGSIIVDSINNRLFYISSLPLSALGMNVVSTAGCGDIYTGVLAAYLYLGLDIVEASIRATIAAALKATKPSARDAPRRADLERIVDEASRRGLIRVREVSLESEEILADD